MTPATVMLLKVTFSMKKAAQGAKFPDERSASISSVVVGRQYGQGGKAENSVILGHFVLFRFLFFSSKTPVSVFLFFFRNRTGVLFVFPSKIKTNRCRRRQGKTLYFLEQPFTFFGLTLFYL